MKPLWIAIPRIGRIIEDLIKGPQRSHRTKGYSLPILVKLRPLNRARSSALERILPQLPNPCLPFVGKRKGRLPGPIPLAHPFNLIAPSHPMQLELAANRPACLLGSLVDLAVVLLVIRLNELALGDGQGVEVAREGTATLILAHFSLLLVCSCRSAISQPCWNALPSGDARYSSE